MTDLKKLVIDVTGNRERWRQLKAFISDHAENFVELELSSIGSFAKLVTLSDLEIAFGGDKQVASLLNIELQDELMREQNVN